MYLYSDWLSHVNCEKCLAYSSLEVVFFTNRFYLHCFGISLYVYTIFLNPSHWVVSSCLGLYSANVSYHGLPKHQFIFASFLQALLCAVVPKVPPRRIIGFTFDPIFSEIITQCCLL